MIRLLRHFVRHCMAGKTLGRAWRCARYTSRFYGYHQYLDTRHWLLQF